MQKMQNTTVVFNVNIMCIKLFTSFFVFKSKTCLKWYMQQGSKLFIILQKWLCLEHNRGFSVKDLAQRGYNHPIHPIRSFWSLALRLSGYNSADDTCTCLLGLGNFSKHSYSFCIVCMACWQEDRWGEIWTEQIIKFSR